MWTNARLKLATGPITLDTELFLGKHMNVWTIYKIHKIHKGIERESQRSRVRESRQLYSMNNRLTCFVPL